MLLIRNYITIITMLWCTLTFTQNTPINDPELLKNNVDLLIKQAQKQYETNNYFNAKRKLDDALEIATQINYQKGIGLIYSKIGKINYNIEEPEKAIVDLLKATNYQRFAKDYINLAETYKTLGDVYTNQKKHNQALEYYQSSRNLFEQEDLEEFIAEVLLKLGVTYFTLEDYKKASSNLGESITIASDLDLQKIHSSALIHLGKTYEKNKNLSIALKTANHGVTIAQENNYSTVLTQGYLVLSNLNEKAKNYKLANSYLKKHIDLSNSLINLKRENLSPDKRLQFLLDNQTEYQKKQAADLQELQDSRNLSQLTALLSVALITILSLLTMSLYKNNRIRLKSNKILHRKNEELLHAKEKAEQASKTKANFLSTVTHELRTPLYAVTGLSNMLLEENPKPEQLQHLKSLKFSGDYLLTFINDILQINKIEANKEKIESETFNLKTKAQNVIAALNNSALKNNVNLHYDYDSSLPENFHGDQLKISQILINLIGNAIKFTKDGDIWIRISNKSEINNIYKVCIEIEDNGIGISKEKQEHMYESFSQGSIEINRKYGGTGLGLSIVKGLVDLLNGTISFKSKLGAGTTFTFHVPLEGSTADPEAENSLNEIPNFDELIDSNIQVLIVEDNKINQMITKKILDKMHLKCDLAGTGEEAVEKARAKHYDIILMDIHMPGISGLEATKIIRTIDSNLTIIALTAVTIDDNIKEFNEAGFTEIISKPFKKEDFEKKLYQVIQKKEII
ncbi:MAG: ATP-binding protein [Oceanihabitans sp.]